MADNIGYAIGNNKWFLGQVPPAQNQHVRSPIWNDNHGDRVKVRIPGMHPMSSRMKKRKYLIKNYHGQLLQNQPHMEIVMHNQREFGVENG